jgi:LmbE family N-acetylglucosaminyl deacetylase
VDRRRRTTALALGALLATAAACSPSPADPPTATATQHTQKAAPCRRTLVGVAHPDDDVFFLNPEIRRTIRAGCPVDTVYLTAGDGGKNDLAAAKEYAGRREFGVRAAYAEAAEADDRWTRADVTAAGVRVRAYRLADKSRDTDVRLMFLDLHDGLPRGVQAQSLRRLYDGDRSSVTAFRGGERYTEDRLLGVLTALARGSGAARVLTMDADDASFAFGLGGGVDHSDHGVTARYLRRVGYALGMPVSTYLGYTMSPLKPNLGKAQAAEKDEVARWYIANRDCHALGSCRIVTPFKGRLRKDWALWVRRQYEQVHRDPRPGEILGDIGRTTYFTGRDPVQCLHAGVAGAHPDAVDIRGCDGSAPQKWDLAGDGTIVPRASEGSCLTALASSVGLAPCAAGREDQHWRRVPWRSATWRRTAWRIEAGDGRCLYQDDRVLPARWDSRDAQSPALRLVPCGSTPRPELYWRWAD